MKASARFKIQVQMLVYYLSTNYCLMTESNQQYKTKLKNYYHPIQSYFCNLNLGHPPPLLQVLLLSSYLFCIQLDELFDSVKFSINGCPNRFRTGSNQFKSDSDLIKPVSYQYKLKSDLFKTGSNLYQTSLFHINSDLIQIC